MNFTSKHKQIQELETKLDKLIEAEEKLEEQNNRIINDFYANNFFFENPLCKGEKLLLKSEAKKFTAIVPIYFKTFSSFSFCSPFRKVFLRDEVQTVYTDPETYELLKSVIDDHEKQAKKFKQSK